MTFREFATHLHGLTTYMVGRIEGENDIVPMVHFASEGQFHSIVFDATAWLEDRPLFVESLVLPYVDVLKPEFVGWTFTGRRGPAEGEWDHETAVAVCIDREVHETWLARLVRHDNTASLGAWRSWPPNQQEGAMLTPIQEALR